MFGRASARLWAVVLLIMVNLCVARQLPPAAPNITKLPERFWYYLRDIKCLCPNPWCCYDDGN